MKLLIAGAGGHGRVVADAAAASAWQEIAFIDDAHARGHRTEQWPVVGTLRDLSDFAGRYSSFVAASGDAVLRLKWLAEAQALGFDLPNIIHPSATVSVFATLGPGTVVMGGAVINIGSRLGRGCIVNTGATVDHDCRLGDGVHICPGAHLAGDVEIKERSWIGIGSAVHQGIRIGADVTVGAGAACVRDIADRAVVMGVPAREQES